nr:hypothetical protein Q903MT_gene3486 [Picea sitchensis]
MGWDGMDRMIQPSDPLVMFLLTTCLPIDLDYTTWINESLRR